jgi:hypothetical protein
MVGLSDPGTLGKLDLYETPQGTTGPANADAEISADSTVSKDISLLDTKGSEVLLGETLMVPIANSMVYVRPLYVSPTTNPQPQLEYVIAVLGKNVQIDTSLPNVLSDLLGTTVLPPGQAGTSTGTVPSAVAGILQQAQTDYTNAQAALKADNLSQFQTDIDAMQAAISQAQQVITATTPSATPSTTTTTVPPIKPKTSKTSATTTTAPHATTTSSSAPTSTEPKNTTTTTSPPSTTSSTLVSAAPKT